MNPSTADPFDFLHQPLVELTPTELKTQQKIMDDQYKEQRLKDVEKVKRVIRHMLANPYFPLRDLVEKFDLDWDWIRDFGNGISKIEFLVGNVSAFKLNLPTSEWFRSHPL